jgi:hypothetical protein
VLGHWANRFEQRASRLLARPRWAEFDFAGLERPNFAVEIADRLAEAGAGGLLDRHEARAKRNLAAAALSLLPHPIRTGARMIQQPSNLAALRAAWRVVERRAPSRRRASR